MARSASAAAASISAPLTLTAAAPLDDSTLASMMRLLERAQTERPRLARAADRTASWFVLAGRAP